MLRNNSRDVSYPRYTVLVCRVGEKFLLIINYFSIVHLFVLFLIILGWKEKKRFCLEIVKRVLELFEINKSYIFCRGSRMI